MSVQLFFLDKMFRVLWKRRFRKNPDILQIRPMMDRMTRMARALPPSIRVDMIDLGGVRTEIVDTKTADSSRAILYIHGGAMVAGSPLTHRALTCRLAERVGVPVYAVDYRLAPEHPFPAALDDCVRAYQELRARAISRIVIAGDSAGGTLTLATTRKLKMLGATMPDALVCLSPATDLLGTVDSRKRNARSDATFHASMFATLLQHYCPGEDAANPLISPMNGDVHGFPPTLFQCSDSEMLADDSILLAAKMRAAGVDVTLEVWPGVFHVWQLAADFLPEGERAITDIVKFTKARLA